jgi:hypothetical protein
MLLVASVSPETRLLRAENSRSSHFNRKIAMPTVKGVVARLGGRAPSRHELVDAIPELDGCPAETVEGGVFISVGEEGFAI